MVRHSSSPTLNTIELGIVGGGKSSSSCGRYAFQVMVIENCPTKAKEDIKDDLDLELIFSKKYARGLFPHENDPIIIKVKCDY